MERRKTMEDELTYRDTMRTVALGTTGTVATVTLHSWNDAMAAIAGTLTVIYMACKLFLLWRENKKP